VASNESYDSIQRSLFFLFFAFVVHFCYTIDNPVFCAGDVVWSILLAMVGLLSIFFVRTVVLRYNAAHTLWRPVFPLFIFFCFSKKQVLAPRHGHHDYNNELAPRYDGNVS
jgi:hypothetical protein